MRAILTNDDPRADQRAHVFLMAVLSSGPESSPVRVRNISANGALLEGTGLPEEGQVVVLRRGSLSVPGQVAWMSGVHCGVRFSTGIQVAEWVDRAGPVGQQRIDAAVADFRYCRGAPTGNKSGGRDPDGRLSEISEDLLRACERISELPRMSLELAEELLKIEAIAHALRG